jgi:hypothetical protein
VRVHQRHEHLSQAAGVRLADGRDVMVKVRDAAPRLVGCAAVQGHVWARGVPCPAPLAGPVPFDPGEPGRWASAEEWRPGGELRVLPPSAEEYGRLLARVVEAAPPIDAVPSLDPPPRWLWWAHGDPSRTWPPSTSAHWDAHADDAAQPAVLLAAGRRAADRLLAPDAVPLPHVVGHGDFEAQNLRWQRATPVDTEDASAPAGWRPTIHDWDSVVALPEPAIAGAAAAVFVSDGPVRLASVEASAAFLDGYCAARGLRWGRVEQEVAWAAGLWVATYNAMFEPLRGPERQLTRRVLADAADRLARAGA